MSKDMNLNFGGLGAGAVKDPASEVKRVAKEAGAAEGFTDRVAVQRFVRAPQVQMNLRVSATARDAIMLAYHQERAKSAAVISIGDFIQQIFKEWKSRQ